MKSKVLDGLTVLTAVAALTVCGFSISDRLSGKGGVAKRKDRRIDNWSSLASQGHRTSGPDGRIVVVEFGDYECPACRQFHAAITSMPAPQRARFHVVYRHLPLQYHKNAYKAARAAECADEQGKFERFHDILMQDESLLGKWDSVAVLSHVSDLPKFHSCAQSEQRNARVETDIKAANALSPYGTPAVVIQGWLMGNTPLDTAKLREALDKRGHD